MSTPPNLTVALLMMIASAICWGSWANTYKGSRIIVSNCLLGLRDWHFFDFLDLRIHAGSSGHDWSSFLNNVQTADGWNIMSTAPD